MKKIVISALLVAGVFCSVQAGDITRADTAGPLSLGTAWIGGNAPGSGDVAVWNSALGAKNRGAELTVDTSWAGIRLGSSIANGITISNTAGAGTLTLGASGIDITNSLGALTVNSKVALGTSQTWASSTNKILTVNGVVSGADGSVLTKSGSGVLFLYGNNNYSGGTIISQGRLSITNGNALGSGSVTLAGGNLFAVSNTTQRVTVTNNIILGTGAVGTFAQDNTTTQVITGVISGDGTMQKVNASGTLVLTGANTYTNTTAVGAGKMFVDGSMQSRLITVGNGGTLMGTGTVQSVMVNANALLSVGESPGTMTFNGSLTLGNGSTNLMEIFTTGSDVIKGNGGVLTMSGTTILDFTGNTVADYTALNLFQNWGSIVTNSTATFTAVGLGSGQSLDLSHLTTGGPITVIPEPATIGMLGLGALVTLLLRRMRAY